MIEKKQKNKLILIHLFTLIAAVVFTDFLRKFFDKSSLFLLLIDIQILSLIFYTFAMDFRVFWKTLLGILTLFFVTSILIIGLFSSLLSPINDWNVFFAGGRAYWIGFVGLFLGNYIFAGFDKEEFISIYKVTTFLLVIITVFALIQKLPVDCFSSTIFADVVCPMTVATHNYNHDLFRLSTSFFASEKRLAYTVFSLYLILWSISKTYQIPNYAVTTLVAICLFLSGARDTIWFFAAFLLLNILLNIKMKPLNLGFFLITTLAILFIIPGFFEKNTFKYFLALDDSIYTRLLMMFPIFSLNFGNFEIIGFTGLGIGVYGVEALLNQDIYDFTYTLPEKVFTNHASFNAALSFGDSGYTKLFVELGLLGIVLFALFHFKIFLLSLYNLLHINRVSHYTTGMSILMAFWITIFLKNHTILSNSWLNLLFFTALGFILSEYTEKRSLNRGISGK